MKRITEWFLLRKWAVIVCWRHVTGRWFIFRDVPIRFVYLFSIAEPTGNGNTDEIIKAAGTELRARINQADRSKTAEGVIEALNVNGG